MSNFYVNFSVKGVGQKQVVEVLERTKRKAIVTPAQAGYVVVYEEQSEKKPATAIDDLGALLSRELKKPTLAAQIHDDNVFSYSLFEGGKRTDTFSTLQPASSDPAARGGDPAKLCATLNTNASVSDLEDILRSENVEGVAVYLHMQLAQVLGLPSWSVGLGFESVSDGEARELMNYKLLTYVNR